MFVYEKKLQYPVKIANPNPKYAKIILDQYGGPDGELGASLRYLSQRFTMPYAQLKGLLTDIGTEELGHLEMIGAIVHQLTRNLTPEEIKKGGFDAYFVTHTAGVYPAGANGMPYSAGSMQCKGDTIADLMEDMAAEQKARVTYDNILRLVDDPDVRDPIKFLREREIVHFQRFGEGLRMVTDGSTRRTTILSTRRLINAENINSREPQRSTRRGSPKNCLFYEADGDIFKSLPARKESGKIVLHLKRSAALHGIDELYILALGEFFELRGCKRQTDGIVVNAEV